MVFNSFKWLLAVGILINTLSVCADKNNEAGRELLSMDEVTDRYNQADLVSVIQVKFISSLINPALSVKGLLAVVSHMYTAQVVRPWKGTQLMSFKIRVDLSDCASRLQKDSEYLVFSHRIGYDLFQTYHCDDLVLREDAEALVAALDKIQELRVAKRTKKDYPAI